MNDRSWLHELAECPSTNSWAIAHLSRLRHGDVVWAQVQTAGRGQRGRVWHSTGGGLTASYLLTLPVEQLPPIGLVAGLAIIYAVESLLPELHHQLQLKWPNDVLLKRRKLAGILCESTIAPSAKTATVIIGIGLNCRLDFDTMLQPELASTAISLHQVVEKVPPEREWLDRIRDYLLQAATLLQQPQGFNKLLPALRQRDALQHRPIVIQQSQCETAGTALGIDELGRLQLQLSDGTIRAIRSGHVVW